MKKFFYLLFLPLTFCSNEETAAPTDYALNLVGDYKLMSMECETAVDLNFDGVAQTNIRSEVDCLIHNSFSFLRLEIRINGESRFFNYPTVNSFVPLLNPPFSQCFSIDYMPCMFDFDNVNKKIIITSTNAERELEYGKLLNVDYVESEKKITIQIQTKLFTSDGWQTVKITSVYKNIYDDNFEP